MTKLLFTWKEIVNKVINSGIDTIINEEEEFFICPECREPIFKDDFPKLSIACPICEEDLF